MAPFLFAKKMRSQQAIQLFGEGVLKRDFTYIGDTVFAIARLIQNGISQTQADVVNIGHSNPVQVNDFVQTLADCMNIKPSIELLPMQVSDVPLTCASDDKLRKMIGEWPHTSLSDGLSEMVQWLEKWNPV
jgi:UDP-glucuronate 4-epimerase